MAIEPTSSQQQHQQVEVDNVQQQNGNEQQQQQQNGHEQIQNGHSVESSENQLNNVYSSELHQFCAEGKLDQVRNVLQRGGIENMENPDPNTSCTPIVLAIRGSHYEVVRELLLAGAIVPPHGVTNDPSMLSILYPQPIYGIPPQFMGIPPQEFYPQQNGFYPDPQQQQRGMFVGQPQQPQLQQQPIPNNLPPADVSRTIPCRNFPNCKYGNACAFFHPVNIPQQQQPRQPQPFYPSVNGPNGNFIPQGYENGYPSAPYQSAPGPYFIPNNQAFVPSHVEQQQQQQPASDIPQQQQQQQTENINNNTQHEQSLPIQVPQQQQQQHVPSAIAPIFVPGFQPPTGMMSPPPNQQQFGLPMSPISPSMLGTSLPTIPPAEAFYAASSPPPNGFIPSLPPVSLNGHPSAAAAAVAHARRLSFNQQQQQPQQFGLNGKPFGHGKKPSFSGAPKPWLAGRQNVQHQNGSAKLGSWKDGNLPPCLFFAQGNCKNGEYCRFPHLDAQGNDSRHPDVINGTVAPQSFTARAPRGMRMMGGPGFNGPVDPSFRQQQQQQQQIQFLHHQRMAAAQAQQGLNASASTTEGETSAKSESAPAVEGEAAADAEKNEATTVPTVTVDGETSAPVEETNTNLPAKPTTNGATPTSIVRSASQPGLNRVHINGNNSRSHSPALSNVSFHGSGHPRRGGSRIPPQINGHGHTNGNGFVNGHPNGSRSSSAGEKKIQQNSLQRVPQAHEFPALGLSSGSTASTPTTEKKESNWNGKTAAQVLSAPAPPKPEPVVKVTNSNGEVEVEGSESGKSGKDNSITMDSDSESDAVIISTKPSSAAQSGQASPAPANATPAPASEIKKAPISFASAVGAAGIPLEPTTVALKA